MTMRVFVMSDLHGRYHTYRAMLDKIRFGKEDVLYLLGDLCDRGPYGRKLYLDVMDRPNVHTVMGNHEHMALDDIVSFVQEYRTFSQEERRRIYEFMQNMPLIRSIQVGGRTYLLSHTISDQRGPDARLKEHTAWDFLWERPSSFHPNLRIADLPQNTGFIIGHTPTLNITPHRPDIFFGEGNIINVDCGAGFPQYGGRLGCLQLDNGTVEYLDIVKEDWTPYETHTHGQTT